MRIGIGYDIHKLAKGRKMVLGGIELPFDKGPLGHSDGDVLLHAVCDAILGAMGQGDIGMMFPDTDPVNKDADSAKFLERIISLMKDSGYTVNNLDCTVIAEAPKLRDHKSVISKRISGILGVADDKVNIKGKTAEKMGDIGQGKAIAAYAAVLLQEKT